MLWLSIRLIDQCQISVELIAVRKQLEQFHKIVVIWLADGYLSAVVSISWFYGYLLDWLINTRLTSSLLSTATSRSNFHNIIII